MRRIRRRRRARPAARLATAFLLAWVACGGVPTSRAGSADDRADEAKEPQIPPEHVEVRARVDAAAESVAAATTLDASELAARGLDLADLLRAAPGTRVRDYGGLGSYAVASLRASTSQQVRVRVDGVPWNAAWGGAVDLGLLPASDLESVTVFRGFAPAATGAFGAGGLIDVRTRGARLGARAGILIGELGTRRVHASSAVPWGDGAIRAGVSALDGDGEFRFLGGASTPFDPTDDVLRTRRNNGVEQRAFFVRGTRGDWNWSARHDRTARGVAPAVEVAAPRARTEVERSELAASWERPRGEGAGSWRVDAYARDLDDAFRDPQGDFGRPRDWHARSTGGGFAVSRRALVGDDPLLVRVEADVDRVRLTDAVFEAADRGGARRRALAASAEWIRNRAPWTWTAALRLDRVEDTFLAGAGPVPPPAGDATETAASGKVGVAHDLGGGHLLRATAGRGFRRPGLLELFGDGGVLRGNPELSSETADGIEVGWSWDGAGKRPARVEAFGFAREVDDLIRFVPIGQAAVAGNVARARVRGVELAATVEPLAGLRLDVSVTRQRATDRSGGPAEGRRLVYEPDWLGALAARLRRGRFEASWDATYTGANATDTLDTPDLRIDARIVHDAAVGWRLGGGLRATLEARNVFDRRLLDVLRYPLPGRVLLAGLSWSEETP